LDQKSRDAADDKPDHAVSVPRNANVTPYVTLTSLLMTGNLAFLAGNYLILLVGDMDSGDWKTALMR
jgi:hypothetical protein